MSDEEKAEREHFRSVLSALKNYKVDTDHRINRSYDNLNRLEVRHQELLTKYGFVANLEKTQKCVAVNQSILDRVVAEATSMFENAEFDYSDLANETGRSTQTNANEPGVKHQRLTTKPMDIDKVQSTLKMLVRDWSEDGQKERDTCYKPILDELERLYPPAIRSSKKVLVPGAGLGRLAYDVANLGFQSQGNEFSLFMLFASHFVLNQCKHKNSMTVYPWIHQHSNNVEAEDATRPTKFPDIDPGLPPDSSFAMVAGDFLEVYADISYHNTFDVVVTCFFIDCAHDVIDFVEMIHKILKPGGRWINLGPLLYHFADIPKEPSIEPSYDIVRSIVKEKGFEFEREVTDHQAVYCQNPKSMLQYHYKCVFSTATKSSGSAPWRRHNF